METNVALVVLIGLPGAGKSTVCEKLMVDVESKCENHPSHIIHVCYDDLIPLSVQEKFFQFKQFESLSQNESEQENKAHVNTNTELEGVERPEQVNWKSARRSVYMRVDQLVDSLKGGSWDTDVLEYFNLSSLMVNKEAVYLILLDDNFYYRSMRYEYFQLARKHSVGFCELYINCPLDVALQRNCARETQVPAEVIEAMMVKLEPPLPSEHTWESMSNTLHAENYEDFSALWDMIHKSLKTPVAPLVDRTLEIAEARRLCSSSVAHQADIYLRSLVGQVIKEAHQKRNMTGRELSVFSRTVNEVRQSVLSAVRDGSLVLPLSLMDDVTDDNRDEFQNILECELRKKLP